MMSFNEITKKHKRAQVGYWIGKDYRRKGYMLEALQGLIKFGFEKLDFEKIYARTNTENKASFKLLKKAGFKKEGTLKDHVIKNGKRHSHNYYGLLKSDY